MKKTKKFLAWALAMSLMMTAVPMTTISVYAKDNAKKQATTPNAVRAGEDSYQECKGFELKLNKYEVDIMKKQKVNITCTPIFNYPNTESDITYQWQYRVYQTDTYVDIDGANSSSYVITDTGDVREYRVIAKDADGHTSYGDVWAYHVTGIDTSETKTTYNVKYGKRVTMKVKAYEKIEGESIASYQWYSDGVAIQGATSDTYTTTADDRKYYLCVIKDSTGEEETVFISVNPSSLVKIENEKISYNVVSGGSQTLSVNASTTESDAILSYEWSKYNDETDLYEVIPGANSSSYTASEITSDTTIFCTVSSSYHGYVESESIYFYLTVTDFGLNMTNNINNGADNDLYVPVNKAVKYTVTGNGNIGFQTYSINSKKSDFKDFEKNGNDYYITPTETGVYTLSANIIEGEKIDGVWGCVYAFDVVGNIEAGNTINVTIPQNNDYIGYSIVPSQSGTYTIYTDKEESVYFVDERGVEEPGYVLTSKEYDSDTLYRAKVKLDANKQYYMIVSAVDSSYSSNKDGYAGQQYTLTLVNSVNCAHLNIDAKNVVSATCTTAGYSGVIYCDDCDMLISNGTEIPASGHTTEVRNAASATCTTAGYTGDTVCTVCGEVIASGTTISATGHRTEVRNAIPATCTTDGNTGDTVCTVCGEVIASGTVIPATGHNVQKVNVKAATFKVDGYTGDIVCTTCGTVVTPGTAISKIKSVTVKKDIYTYTGKNIKAVVIVKDAKGNTVDASNYSVTYSKNLKSIGVKSVKVTFRGIYSGSRVIKYTVAPKNVTKLKVASKSGKLNVSWNKQITQTTGYQIQYSAKKNFKRAKIVTINKKKTERTTIKSLKKGNTYYVRIRTYKKVGKKMIASDWSVVKKVKIK